MRSARCRRASVQKEFLHCTTASTHGKGMMQSVIVRLVVSLRILQAFLCSLASRSLPLECIVSVKGLESRSSNLSCCIATNRRLRVVTPDVAELNDSIGSMQSARCRGHVFRSICCHRTTSSTRGQTMMQSAISRLVVSLRMLQASLCWLASMSLPLSAQCQ